MSKIHASDGSTNQPKYMTGYGGHQPQQEEEVEVPKVIHAPVVGYTGSYRGKNIGKLGRCEVHRTRLSVWEKDTVSGILGVPAAEDDWEYSHYTNSFANFNEKKFHESSCVRSATNSPSCASSGGAYAAEVSGTGSGALYGAWQETTQQLRREESESDRILSQIQMALESRFKSATLARSGLKSAFFAADRARTGLLPTELFFEVLHRMTGAALSAPQQAHLAWALHHAGHRRGGSSLRDAEYGLGSARLEQEDECEHAPGPGLLEAECVEEVCYGRFLNIVVPRSSKVASPAKRGSPL